MSEPFFNTKRERDRYLQLCGSKLRVTSWWSDAEINFLLTHTLETSINQLNKTEIQVIRKYRKIVPNGYKKPSKKTRILTK